MRVPRDLDRGGVDVDAVCDDAEVGLRLDGAGRGAQQAEDAWVAVVQGPHGVEEVRDAGCAGAHGEFGFLVRGFGVAD